MPRERKRIFLVLVVLSALVGTSQTFGQQRLKSDTGLPFFTLAVNSGEYAGSAANWSVAEGADGRIFVGNDKGLLVYDGVHWDQIEQFAGLMVRSLMAGPSNQIYVGAYNDFGFLATNATGQTTYTSLAEGTGKSFGNVWTICALETKVFFGTSRSIFAIIRASVLRADT